MIPVNRRFIASAVAASLVATACGGATESLQSEAATTSAAATAVVPAFLDRTVELVDGGSLDLADYVGDDLVLWFWAPW